MTQPVARRSLRALPKAHLHVHLDAAVRPSTLREFAPDARAGREAFSNFAEFIHLFRELSSVLAAAPERVLRVVDEAVEDAADDGAVYIELAVRPEVYEVTFGSYQLATRALAQAAMRSGARHGVEARIMVTLDRAHGVRVAPAAAACAVELAHMGVASMGLANQERLGDTGPFAPAFASARNAGLVAAPHAGELVGAPSVRDAVEVLGATRIGHGVRAVEDEALVAELARKRICLDVCPTSNVVLGVVESWAAHPLPRLIEAGVPCSINADDPTLFGVGILGEYEACRREMGMSDDMLAQCAADSIRFSSASATTKANALAGIAHWLRSSP